MKREREKKIKFAPPVPKLYFSPVHLHSTSLTQNQKKSQQGPTTEELIWRSLIIPLHLAAHIPPITTILATPLYFGIAHVHHFYEFRLTHPHNPLAASLARTLFQFTYTSLFGSFAAFVFVRTASLPAAVIAHAFCNWMGLPRLWGRVGPPPGRSAVSAEGVGIGPAGVRGEGRRAECGRGAFGGGGHVVWTVAYYVLLVGGAVGFWRLLWPLTDSENALAKFAA